MKGIKNTDKILEMKKDRFIKEVIIAATSRGVKPPFVKFDGELCPGYDGNQWAHYHPDSHLICVPKNMLRIMDEFQLKNTAIHEVSHIFDLTHDPSFFQEMEGTGIAGLELPPGVTLTYEGMPKPEIKRDKRKERVDRTRCNHHSCRKRRKLTQCPHCDSYYCHEHFPPYEPGLADIKSFNPVVRNRGYERGSMEVYGHACGEYIDFKRREEKERTYSVLRSMDKGRVLYIIPEDIVCDYKPCNVRLKDERRGHLCRSCNMTFCKKHKRLEDHECVVLELAVGEHSQEDIIKPIDIPIKDSTIKDLKTKRTFIRELDKSSKSNRNIKILLLVLISIFSQNFLSLNGFLWDVKFYPLSTIGVIFGFILLYYLFYKIVRSFSIFLDMF